MGLREFVSVSIEINDLLASGTERQVSFRRCGVTVLDDPLGEFAQLSTLDETAFVEHPSEFSLGNLLDWHGRQISHVAP
jgi:hypothetical protein